MTIEDQVPAADEQQVTSPAGDAAPKEKKSMLKLVKDKAKDKVKRFGSKLKPKGHDNGDKQQESVGEADEDEEMVDLGSGDAPQPQVDSTSRDLDVPLDEYALIKQKEAESKDDEASVSGVGENLTEGLSSQSIAEQEPADDATPDALQAVPTEYKYKEEEGAGKENDAPSELSSGAADAGAQDRSWPKEDLSLKTQGQAGDGTDEKSKVGDAGDAEESKVGDAGDAEESTKTPTVTPRDQEQGGGETIFASKDGSSPQFTDKSVEELSSSNVYTGEPDVKPKGDDTGTSIDKAGEEDETSKGDASVASKTGEEQEELKENVPSADSKLQDETSANVYSSEDKHEAGAEKTPEPEQSSDVTNRSLDTGEENFADAKPVISQNDEAESAGPEVIGGESGESGESGKPFEDSSSNAFATDEKSEQSAEPEIIGKDSGAEVPSAFEDSSTKDVESKPREGDELRNASMETQVSSETGNALEKSLGSSGAEKSEAEIKEENVSEAAPTSDSPALSTEVKENSSPSSESDIKEEAAPTSDSREADIKQDDTPKGDEAAAPLSTDVKEGSSPSSESRHIEEEAAPASESREADIKQDDTPKEDEAGAPLSTDVKEGSSPSSESRDIKEEAAPASESREADIKQDDTPKEDEATVPLSTDVKEDSAPSSASQAASDIKEEVAPASESREADIKQDDTPKEDEAAAAAAPVSSGTGELEAPKEAAAASDSGETKQAEAVAPPQDSGVAQKLTQLKESIATKLGYGSTPASEENVKAEQDRIVDAKTKELVGGSS